MVRSNCRSSFLRSFLRSDLAGIDEESGTCRASAGGWAEGGQPLPGWVLAGCSPWRELAGKADCLPGELGYERVPMLLLKAILVWLCIAVAETANGIARVKLLNRRFGDRGARRVGVLTGSAIIFLIGWVSLPWIGPANARESLLVGVCWLALMLGFDIGFGLLVFRVSWRRIAADFNLLKGNLLALGMMVLLVTPFTVAKMRGMF